MNHVSGLGTVKDPHRGYRRDTTQWPSSYVFSHAYSRLRSRSWATVLIRTVEAVPALGWDIGANNIFALESPNTNFSDSSLCTLRGVA